MTSPPFDLRRVSDLVPFARNARTHSDEQIDQIAASLRSFRWTIPILIRLIPLRRLPPRLRLSASTRKRFGARRGRAF